MCVCIYSYSRPFFNEEQKRTNNKMRLTKMTKRDDYRTMMCMNVLLYLLKVQDSYIRDIIPLL